MDQNLLPSNIRFSQDSINSVFSDALGNQKIGIVLDKIYNGDVQTKAQILKDMKVARAPPKYKDLQDLWFTVNNRSLWVLKELELLGKLNDPLSLKVDTKCIAKKRFSTENEGRKVLVRNPPVGGTNAKKAPFWDDTVETIGGGAEMLESGYDSDEYYE